MKVAGGPGYASTALHASGKTAAFLIPSSRPWRLLQLDVHTGTIAFTQTLPFGLCALPGWFPAPTRLPRTGRFFHSTAPGLQSPLSATESDKITCPCAERFRCLQQRNLVVLPKGTFCLLVQWELTERFPICIHDADVVVDNSPRAAQKRRGDGS